ncbi:hypothetical protein BC831DRAFT_171031 [Entophlyctis helioformis]|nr:hypothetical protein BC831DRAFT_171031 [Entophlyctis helioformis]
MDATRTACGGVGRPTRRRRCSAVEPMFNMREFQPAPCAHQVQACSMCSMCSMCAACRPEQSRQAGRQAGRQASRHSQATAVLIFTALASCSHSRSLTFVAVQIVAGRHLACIRHNIVFGRNASKALWLSEYCKSSMATQAGKQRRPSSDANG